jgi:plastocyanin
MAPTEEDLNVSLNAARRATMYLAPKASIAAVAVGMLAVSGCGSSSSGTSSSASTPTTAASPTTSSAATSSTPAATPGAASTVSLSADAEGQLKYDTTSLAAKAGKVSIDFTNTAPLAHNVTIESASGTVVGATPTFQGGSKTLSVNLKPGTYKFYCTVPGHRAAGMEGTLTVK